MTELKANTVLCDNCKSFAVASLDNTPLCSGCLYSAFIASWSPSLIDQIAPLLLTPGPMRQWYDELDVQHDEAVETNVE